MVTVTTTWLLREKGKLEANQIAAPRPATIRLLADAFGVGSPDRDDFCTAAVAMPSPTAAVVAESRPTAVPAQLPADVADFTGRVDQLAALDSRLGSDGTGPVIITAIGGTAGVGKTKS